MSVYGIYNAPTFHGSWNLVPDISWQSVMSRENSLSTFHRKFMAWKIDHEHEISAFRALKNAFPGFLMSFSWDFHNIAVHSASGWLFRIIVLEPCKCFTRIIGVLILPLWWYLMKLLYQLICMVPFLFVCKFSYWLLQGETGFNWASLSI